MPIYDTDSGVFPGVCLGLGVGTSILPGGKAWFFDVFPGPVGDVLVGPSINSITKQIPFHKALQP